MYFTRCYLKLKIFTEFGTHASKSKAPIELCPVSLDLEEELCNLWMCDLAEVTTPSKSFSSSVKTGSNCSSFAQLLLKTTREHVSIHARENIHTYAYFKIIIYGCVSLSKGVFPVGRCDSLLAHLADSCIFILHQTHILY